MKKKLEKVHFKWLFKDFENNYLFSFFEKTKMQKADFLDFKPKYLKKSFE